MCKTQSLCHPKYIKQMINSKIDYRVGLPQPLNNTMKQAKLATINITLQKFLQEHCILIPEYGVYATTAYHAFSLMKENRDIDLARVNAIANSYEEDGYFFPIIKVNEKLEQIDGQHRFAAAEQRKLPIYFHIYPLWGIDKVIALNLKGSMWSMDDYLSSYVKREIKSYTRFEEFCKNNGVTTNLGLELAQHSGGKNAIREFKTGDFKFSDAKLQEALQIASHWNELGEYHPNGFKRKSFIRSVRFIMKQRGYDPKRMMKQLRELPDLSKILRNARSMNEQGILTEFTKIYNKNLRENSRIDFIKLYEQNF